MEVIAHPTILVDVAGLLPYAKNSKQHSPAQVTIIAESVKKYGWTNPCLIADGGLLAGHGRILAAKQLGLARVPCIDLSHLSDEQRRAYVIMDNRSAETGASWDLEMLKLETDELRGMGLDLEASTGWAEDDLADLLRGLEAPLEPVGGADDAPEPPLEPMTQMGDTWLLGEHRLHCGSSTEAGAWDVLMGEDEADICWTDPPYNVDIGAKNIHLDRADGGKRSRTGELQNDAMPDAEFRKFLRDAFTQLYARMKRGAPIYVAYSDREAINFRSAFCEAGFKASTVLIWRKNQLVLSLQDYHPIHEPVLYGWKGGLAHRWYGGRRNTTVFDLGEESPFTKLEDGRYKVQVGDFIFTLPADAQVDVDPASVFRENKPAKSGLHPTQKPVQLIGRMLRLSARPGAVVVDAFGGSGSTLIACEQLGMKARLMELEPRYADATVMRWQALTGGRAVLQGGGFFGDARPVVEPAGADVF